MTTAFSVLGKAFGFFISIFIAAWFGVSKQTDAFFFAYGLVMFLTVIVTNSVENVIVPFIAEIKRGKPGAVYGFVGGLIRSIAAKLLTLAFPVFAVVLAALFTLSGFDRSEIMLIMKLFAATIPLFILSALTSVICGVLNTAKKFYTPAVSPGFRAVATIAAIFILKDPLGVYAIPAGYILGEALRLAILVIFAVKGGVLEMRSGRYDSGKKVSDFFKTASFQIAAMVCLGFNPIIDRFMASWLAPGSVSMLEYAERLYIIPITFMSGGFSITALSYWSNEYYKGDGTSGVLRNNVISSWKALVPASLAVTFILVVISGYFVRIFYGHGAFPQEKLGILTLVWVAYLAGFVPYVLSQTIVMKMLVLKKTKDLLKIAAMMNVLNIILNLVLMRYLGLVGIALATSTAQLAAFFVLLKYFLKKTDITEV